MYNSPKVSVITPAYNAQSTIGETIESVLSQTFTDFEMIIIDDGSTDDTANVVHRFKDNRIIYLYQTNKEKSEARNNGIKNAKGKYIAFLDADDTWFPEKLEKQVRLMQNNPEIGLVYSDLYYFDDETGEDLILYSRIASLHRGKIPIELLLENNFIKSNTPLIRRKIFCQVGLFDTNLDLCEDWEMWLRIIVKYPIDYIDEPLARYRIHTKVSFWDNKPEALYKFANRMIDKTEASLVDESLVSTNTIRKSRGMVDYNYGTAMYRKKRYSEAVRSYNNAIKRSSFFPKAYLRLIQAFIFKTYTKLSLPVI